MLSDGKLDKSFWAEAVSTAVYLRNRISTISLKTSTPYEALFGRKPSVKHLKIFGCACYPHIPGDERSKLDPKVRRCIFLGYSSESKAYRVYDKERKKIIISRDIVFNESQRSLVEKEQNASSLDSSVELPYTSDVNNNVDEANIDENLQVRRSLRNRREPERYGDWTYVACNDKSDEPSNFNDAIKSDDCDKWKVAMQNEIDSIKENNVMDFS